MPSEWQDNPGYAPAGDFEAVEVLYGDELRGVGLTAELDWDLTNPLPLRIMKWRYAHARDKTPPPADKPPGSGLPPVADASSDYTDMEKAARAIFGIEAKPNDVMGTPASPCKCIDCGGTEPSHSSAYMKAFDKPLSVQDTLAQRGSRYGDFTTNAEISQHLKSIMETNSDGSMREGWRSLTCVQREALTMIAQKIARILNGDPNYKDNWHDIQGYARLAEDRCKSSD